jgi:hypothetical protein
VLITLTANVVPLLLLAIAVTVLVIMIHAAARIGDTYITSIGQDMLLFFLVMPWFLFVIDVAAVAIGWSYVLGMRVLS